MMHGQVHGLSGSGYKADRISTPPGGAFSLTGAASPLTSMPLEDRAGRGATEAQLKPKLGIARRPLTSYGLELGSIFPWCSGVGHFSSGHGEHMRLTL